MAIDTTLQQLALGMDQAKKAVYTLMKKYYPKIEDSQSALVNAIISGVALLYSMYQVFAKLIQGELYVSQARELASLYKLIPLVGIELNQPTPMLITAAAQPQDPSITDSFAPQLYIGFANPFVDSSSYEFYQNYKQYARKAVFFFLSTFGGDPAKPFFVSTDGKGVTLSLGKMLGDDFVPPSLLASDTDIVVEFPYYSGTVKLGKIRFTPPAADLAVVTPIDNGSATPGDLDLINTKLWLVTGRLQLTLITGSFINTAITGLPVNITYSVRSTYLKPSTITGQVASSNSEAAAGDFYKKATLWSYRHVSEDPATYFISGGSVGFFVINAYDGYDANHNKRAVSVDPYSVKITGIAPDGYIAGVVYDFSNAEQLSDPYWGVIYRTSVVHPIFGDTWYGYILDEYTGMIAVESTDTGGAADWHIDFTTKPANKVFLKQFDSKAKSVSPPADFNFDNNTFTLIDNDPIMFENLNIRITDAGYTSTVFKQVTSLVTVIGNNTVSYFEVRLLAVNKVEIKFSSGIDYTTITNMLIDYQTVKDISLYKSGEKLTGVVSLYHADGSQYVSAGKTEFQFSAVNITSLAGVSGIPTLEGLRDVLTKAAYTLSTNVTRINYESAIQSYYLAEGFDSRIKVFDYADFSGTDTVNAMINSVNGNIAYFVGIVNRYPNSDFVMVVPTELTSPYIEGTAQNSRDELSALVKGPTTDFGLDYITPVGKTSDDLGVLQNNLREDSALTNILFTQGTAGVGPGGAIGPFAVMYAVYFKAKIKPASGYTLNQAKEAVVAYLVSLFKWSTLEFVKDINVSDTYRELDSLPEVDKILFSNFSHYRNPVGGAYPDGSNVVHDISYVTKFSTPSPTDILNNPLWDFSGINTLNRNIKIHILGLGGIDLTAY